jgi:DNA transposition AAA+ family ATPase
MPAAAIKKSEVKTPPAPDLRLHDGSKWTGPDGRRWTEKEVLAELRRLNAPADKGGGGLSYKSIALGIGVDQGHLHRILAGETHPRTNKTFRPSHKLLKSMIVYLTVSRQTEEYNAQFGPDGGVGTSIPFTETIVAKSFFNLAALALAKPTIAMFCSETSVGKTVAMQEYCRRNPAAIYVHATPWRSSRIHIVNAIWRSLGMRNLGRRSKRCYEQCEDVIRCLAAPEASSASARILLIDDAHSLQYDALETIRCIHDETANDKRPGLPIILAGTTRLNQTVVLSGDAHQMYEQLRARVGLTRFIGKPTADDVLAIAQASAPRGAKFDAKAIEFLCQLALNLGAFRLIRHVVSLLPILAGKAKVDFSRPIGRDDLANAATLIGR